MLTVAPVHGMHASDPLAVESAVAAHQVHTFARKPPYWGQAASRTFATCTRHPSSARATRACTRHPGLHAAPGDVHHVHEARSTRLPDTRVEAWTPPAPRMIPAGAAHDPRRRCA